MPQPELTAAAAEGKGRDLFAATRERHPFDALILLTDRRPGHEGERHMVAVPGGSRWGQLLPPQQEVDITAPDGKTSRK